MNSFEIGFLLALKSIAVYSQVAPGQLLFHRGDAATAIFAVEVGRVKLSRYVSNGTEVCLQVARAKEFFAEAALFSEIYHCDAIAELPSRVAVYSKQAILQQLQDEPNLALQFTARLTQQIQAMRTQLELRNIHSAHDRVLQYLALLAETDSATITFDRPLKDVARDIGLTHEVFYRTLAQLEKEGFIQRDRRQIKLLRA